MKLILDTNAYVGFKLGHTELVEYIIQAEKLWMSPIVLGELMFGFRNGSRIAAQLKQQGTPIPANDIWIAAQTMETGAELVTMDLHFKTINGLVYRLFSPV